MWLILSTLTSLTSAALPDQKYAMRRDCRVSSAAAATILSSVLTSDFACRGIIKATDELSLEIP